jgi:hypothetical protein
LLIHGVTDDECAHRALDFVEAGQMVGVRPDQFRRWLSRSVIISLLKSERAVFLDSICASNPAVLRKTRDTSGNGMVIVQAVRTLEEMNSKHGVRSPGSYGDASAPGISINILPASRGAPAGVTIEGERTLPAAQPPLVFVDPPHRPRPPSNDGPIFNPDYTA